MPVEAYKSIIRWVVSLFTLALIGIFGIFVRIGTSWVSRVNAEIRSLHDTSIQLVDRDKFLHGDVPGHPISFPNGPFKEKDATRKP